MENEKDTFKAFIQSCLDFVVNNKKEEKVCNEDVDKRKLIDEVAGIMKSAGCDDEDIRTAIGKMEKIGYDKSEAKTADNEEDEKADNKKACNKDEEEKEDDKAENKKACNEEDDKKCDDSTDYMEEVANVSKEINNSEEVQYISRFDALEAGKKYFE